MAIAQAIDAQDLKKAEVARRMKTSTSQLNRLLDEKDTGVTLHTIVAAAQATGSRIRITVEHD